MGVFQILPAQHDHGQVQRLPCGIELRYRGWDGRRWIVELVMASLDLDLLVSSSYLDDEHAMPFASLILLASI